MTPQQINAALIAHLQAMPGVPKIAFPNASFTPQPGVTHLEVACLHNTPIDRAITSDCVELMGLFLMTICAPSGQGDGAANRLAQAIREHFRPVQDLGGPVITRTADIRPGFVDGDRWRVPVRVSWSLII